MDKRSQNAELINKIAPPAIDPPSDKISAAKEQKELFDINAETKRSNHTHYITVLSIWILGICGITVLLVRIFHFLAPTCWYWLDTTQLQTLDKMLFSGTVGSLLGKYSGSIFHKDK